MKLPPIHLDAPAAIAFSGGGDSTALIHACRGNPHVTHAFIIDHALREGSRAEAENAASIARAMGYIVKVRRWPHSGIASAIQAKARAYRYHAMGEMCRAHNLQTLLTAHTQDDQAETVLMRIDRGSGWRGMAGMPQTAYAPLWPALAGVTLYRPWLDVSRADIWRYNSHHGLDFVDDPSNENPDFARVRARQALSVDDDLREDLLTQQKKASQKLINERRTHANWLTDHAVLHEQGYVETKAVPPSELLQHILNAVSGRGGPIDAVKRKRLCTDMAGLDFNSATLSGAWVLRKPTADGHSIVFLRNRVAVLGRGGVPKLSPIQLTPNVPHVWDSRFMCTAKTSDIRVEPVQGHLQSLRQLSEFKPLFELLAEVRGTLPLYFHKDIPIGYGTFESEKITSTACSASRLQGMFSSQDSVPN